MSDVVVASKPHKKLKVAKQRIWELDFLRGICVLLMMFDHLLYNIAEVFGSVWALENGLFFEKLYENACIYMESDLRLIVQNIVVWVFSFLFGIS
ncbi:MAG: hypothetical protein RR348_06095, partial [Clostridia bacterium]